MSIITHAELIYDEGTYEPKLKFSGEIPLERIHYMGDLPLGITDEDFDRAIGELLMKDMRDYLKPEKPEKPDYQTWE
jgi:hypothetical protein